MTDGSIIKGVWKEDYLQDQDEYIWSNGVQYIGQFNDDKHEGKGVFVWNKSIDESPSIIDNMKDEEEFLSNIK